MKNVSRIIPCYAADTAGVCSALYELGGMTVVHDASGCNSTYATHDEPRWVDMQSMIYISALTELDAIMGDDEKFIADVTAAAYDQQPRFIAICGSPMPMMTGTDFDAAAAEIEARTGIRTFAMHTNGTHSYIDGAAEALLAVVREYVHEMPKAEGIGVNILGLTPLDLPWQGTVQSLHEWLTANGMTYISGIAMGSTLDEIAQAASARVNLVVSYSGFAAAKYMQERFGIQYVCGVPVGERYAKQLAETLRQSAESGISHTMQPHSSGSCDTIVIGESIYAASVAAALHADLQISARILCPLPTSAALLTSGDLQCSAEEDIEAALAQMQPARVIADPLYRYILPQGTQLWELPHFAFSGRCFDKRIPNLINRNIKEYFHD